MRFETADKLAIGAIVALTLIEVIGTIAVVIAAGMIVHHFVVKFW